MHDERCPARRPQQVPEAKAASRCSRKAHRHHILTNTVHRGPSLTLLTANEKEYGHVVIDTACQRNCLGPEVADGLRTALNQKQIELMSRTEKETFQFGSGDPVVSRERPIFLAVVEKGSVRRPVQSRTV